MVNRQLMSTEIRKQARHGASRKLFAITDALVLPELLLLSLFAVLIPERYWQRCCFRYEWLKWKAGLFAAEKIRRGRSRLAPASDADALEVAASRSEHHTQIMRELILGWNPDILLAGTENIEQALAGGKGAVLWIAHFSFNSLAAKKAFSAAGFRVYHVSRPEHGFSKSLFGAKVLNPLRVKAEARSLAGRIIIDRNRPAESMHRAMQRLRQNALVSITAGAWEGQTLVAVKIFGAELELAAGAPRLACVSGSPLLPVFTVRPTGSRQIQVIVGSPLPLYGASRDIIVKAAAEKFASETARYAIANPEQWRDWEKLR